MGNKQKIKYWLFGFLLALLCIPFLQSNILLIKTEPLDGVVEKSEKPEFDFKDWFKGDFQKKYESYFDENIGFRNPLVRNYNQIDYSLFREGHGKNVVVGLDGYLYEQVYIDEVTGKNFVGEMKMNYKMEKIMEAQHYLESQNKLLFTVLAPGKASYYREFIPKWLLQHQKDTTNYSMFIDKCHSFNLNMLDFRKWFLAMKDTTSIPLYPKQGIHWNYYGVALAADSILKYLDSEGYTPLTKLSWSLEFPDTLRHSDYDIARLLNIICQLPYQKMAYPVFKYSVTGKTVYPKILVIGDSYYWEVINSEVFKNVFEDITFYFYFNSVIQVGNLLTSNPVDELSMVEELKKFDIIMMIQSELNYNNIGFGFAEKLVSELEGVKLLEQEMHQQVLRDSSFAPIIRKVMNEHRFNYESAVTYIADSLSINKTKQLAEITKSIRSNPEWYQSIIKKAEAGNISVEEAIKRDADWVYENNYK